MKKFSLAVNVIGLLLLGLYIMFKLTGNRMGQIIGAGGLVTVCILEIILQVKRLKMGRRENR